MTDQRNYESEWDRVFAVVDATTIAFRFQDGSTVRVPRSIVSRSTILSQTLEDAQDGDEVALQLPAGVLQAWLQHVAPHTTADLLTVGSWLLDCEICHKARVNLL